MHGGGDRDGVTGDGSDLQDLPAAARGITARVTAPVRRVFATLLKEDVISGGHP